jgi:hypothetical protein
MPKSKSKPTATLSDAAKSKTEAAKWTLADETALINFLYDHRSASGDSATFKRVTFNEAAPLLEAIQTDGGPKLGSGCLNKWAQVCSFLFPPRNLNSHFNFFF